MGDHDIYPSLHDVYLDADADEIDSVVDSENVICMQAMIYALLSRAEKATEAFQSAEAQNVQLRDALSLVAKLALYSSRWPLASFESKHNEVIQNARAVLSSVVPKEETP